MQSVSTYEVLEGFVQTTSDTGFKIVERWISYGNQWTGRHAIAGERVKVRIQRGRYLVHMVSHDQELPPEPTPRRSSGGRSFEEERRAIRQEMVKAAIDWLATFAETDRHPTSDDVLTLAAKFEAWIYR